MKQVLVTLMLCFGLVSFAYAQEDISVVEQVVQEEKIQVDSTKRVKEARSEFLQNKKQVLKERTERKAEFKERAIKARAELQAEFKAATSTEAREAIKKEAVEKRAEFKADAQQVRQDWRERVKAYFNTRIENAFERFASHTERVRSADARIVSVLERLEQAGIDVTPVRASLTEARRGIELAEEKMRTVRVNLEQVLETGSQEEVRDTLKQAKEEIKSASQTLRLAYLDIRESVATLKRLIEQEGGEDSEQESETENVESEL